MNKKFALTLLSSPVLFSSVLSLVMMTQPARASETVNSTGTQTSCMKNPHAPTPQLVCMKVNKAAQAPSTRSSVEFAAPTGEQNQENPSAEYNFTEEESDTAVAMFGCDCPACLNAVRQMRGLPPAV
ncbi:hypothetical protein F7734_53035 [Scytonema sp. UIC 10036]|uniref:hypothetical protein n=1 Tax=Scytonema sp. UIC 10036 TaxID=2304196 RepID=UPI0012DA87E7|nr:hypothetical protein [Scytonema sp. UIC 10036]MUH00540.1 hypothetical protein [Scytonema sp. UIC 10036]